MLTWIRVNPVPANILLISGDDSFSELLHDPYVRRYTILLSGTSQLDASLTSAANVIWLWPTLISGGRPLNTSEQVIIKIKTMWNLHINPNTTLQLVLILLVLVVDTFWCAVSIIIIARATGRGKRHLVMCGHSKYW